MERREFYSVPLDAVDVLMVSHLKHDNVVKYFKCDVKPPGPVMNLVTHCDRFT